MKPCPQCAKEAPDGALECPFCGVIFAKWRPRSERSQARSTLIEPRESADHATTTPSVTRRRLALLLILGAGMAVAIVAIYWFSETRPRMPAAGRSQTASTAIESVRVRLREDPVSDFDRELDLPSGPRGLAWKARGTDDGEVVGERLASSQKAPGTLSDLATTAASTFAGSTDTAYAAELRRTLRSDLWSERVQAETELRSLGLPVDYVRDQETPTSKPASDAASIFDWIVEIRDGDLYGSWHLYFGEDLFSDAVRRGSATAVNIPLFVHYSIRVDGPRVGSKELEFEGTRGDHRKRGVLLASNLGPGGHTAYIHLHVQYVDSNGEAKILNRTSVVLQVEQ